MNAMLTATEFKQVTLQPGEFYFSKGKIKINTLRGCCVAITLWHPDKHLGGMYHYMLPYSRTSNRLEIGFFANGDILMFLKVIKKHQTLPHEYQVKLFGGSNMLHQLNSDHQYLNVAKKNIAAGLKLHKKHGFNVQNMDFEGSVHRQVYLELLNGDVWVKYGECDLTRVAL
jgi:chemotaxis protein CheD